MDKFDLFKHMAMEAKHIVISTHIHPDADGIGSQVALCIALRSLGKEVVCVNEEALLERYEYLDPHDSIISHNEYRKTFGKKRIDLFIVVDASSANRIGGNMQKMMENASRFLFIDHHPCSPAVAAIHCIDTGKAATGELVAGYIAKLGIKLDQDMARALYTSILIDTSSFRYPTVTGDTHRVLGKILDTGINAPVVYNQIYGTKRLSYMRLLGRILSSAQSTDDDLVGWIIVPENLVDEYGCDHEDTHGFVNHLLILDNIKVAVMFRNKDDNVKISFRSDGTVDVGEMAQALGGGGHNHSAATVLEGDIEDIVPYIIQRVQMMLKT